MIRYLQQNSFRGSKQQLCFQSSFSDQTLQLWETTQTQVREMIEKSCSLRGRKKLLDELGTSYGIAGDKL